MRSLFLVLLVLAPGAASAQEVEDDSRLDHELFFPTLGIGLGYGRHSEGDDRNAFELDVTAGVRSVWTGRHSRNVGLIAETGYARHGATPGGHHALAGATLLFGREISGVSIGPGIYGVFGRSEGERALGIRTVLLTELFFSAFGVELSHEWRRVGDADDHMVRVMFVLRIEGLVLIGALAHADWDFN